MKLFKILFYSALVVLVTATACEDDKELVPEWESAINGFGQLPNSSAFIFNDPDVGVDVALRWISIDSKASVEKIDVYVLFDEPYVDKDGNPAIAAHGGEEGVLLESYSGSNVPANRQDLTFSVLQSDIFELYSDASFDYDGDGVATPVFENPDKPERDDVNRVLPGDAITVRWEFTAADGRVFKSWSPSVCTEFPGSNCLLSFTSVCVSDLAGTYDYTTTNIGTGTGGNAAACGGSATGSGELEALGGGRYSVSDATFGVFPCAWSDDPVTDVVLTDVCSDISFSGTDQYGDSYTLTVVSNDGTSLTIDWINTYGDKGRSTLTRTDGKSWPLELY